MSSSGMYNDPAQRSRVKRSPVRTVVPTMLGAFFETSRRPRAEAKTTLPHKASPQGAIAMIALPIGFFHCPSIGVGAFAGMTPVRLSKTIDAALFILQRLSGRRMTGTCQFNESHDFSG